jgi:hypothetical protein
MIEVTEYKTTLGEDMVLITYIDENRTESMYKWQYEERLAAQAKLGGTL